MIKYFNGICKACGVDTDATFCSFDCEQEWQEGYADYLYELEKDRRMEEGDGWL